MYVVDQVVSNSTKGWNQAKFQNVIVICRWSYLTDCIVYVSELFGYLFDDCLINSCALYHKHNNPYAVELE